MSQINFTLISHNFEDIYHYNQHYILEQERPIIDISLWC